MRMNYIATIAQVTAADLIRERRLNETILEGEIQVDVAHYLRAFDEYYADDVVIAESAPTVPVRGKRENRARLESFMIFAHVVYEVGEYRLDHFRLVDSWVEKGVCYSDWELEYSTPEGVRNSVAWRIARRWCEGRVVYEQLRLLARGVLK
jgi:hypothetical protein